MFNAQPEMAVPLLFCVGRGRKGERGLGRGQTEHAPYRVLGFFEALVGFAVTLLCIFEVVAEFFENVGEGFHLLLHSGKAAEEALGVFFDLHAPQAHGDDAEMNVERVGRDGDDVAVATVSVDGLAFGVERGEQFAIDTFGGDKHQGDVERAFVGDDVFLGDGIGVALDGDGESTPRFVAVGGDAAEGVQGKLGVDGHEFFVAQEDDGVRGFSAGEAVLRGELRRRKRIFEKALEGHFAEEAAGLGAAENVFQGLRGEREAAALLLHFADLLLNQADLLSGVFELGGDGRLPLGGDVRGAGDAVLQGFGDAFETLRNRLADGLDLSGALRLRLRDGEEVAAELGELGFEGGAFLLRLRDLEGQPEDDDGQNDSGDEYGGIHRLLLYSHEKEFTTDLGSGERKSITTGARGLERLGCGEKAAIRERLGGADAVKAAARLPHFKKYAGKRSWLNSWLRSFGHPRRMPSG